MINALNSIIDLSSIKLYQLYNANKNIDQKFEKIKQFIKCNRIQKRIKIRELNKYYSYN